jgi:hypothetical protein
LRAATSSLEPPVVDYSGRLAAKRYITHRIRAGTGFERRTASMNQEFGSTGSNAVVEGTSKKEWTEAGVEIPPD